MIRTLTRSFFFALIFTTIFIVALGSYFYSRDRAYINSVYPNVSINGEAFGGKSPEDIKNYFHPQNDALKHTIIEVAYKDTVATFSGEMLDLHFDTEHITEQAMYVGRSTNTLSQYMQRVAAIFNLKSFEFTYKPTFNFEPITYHLAELESTYNVPAQNALFEFEDDRVTTFKFEENGRIVDRDKAREEILSYLKSDAILQSNYKRISVDETVLEPDITVADSNQFGIVEKIGEGRSDYTGSSAEREHNIVVAAQRFHGVLIPPGEIFSFNEHIGEISRATGFKTSYVIKDGRTVLGDGGGVCQDSTTLFRAALNTGLPIVERHAHAYRVKYYENDRKPGFDATIYTPSVDLRFKNDTEAHILIQSKVDQVNNTLVFEFYGKSDGRTVELSDATVYDYRPPPEPLYIDDPTLPAGVTKQVDWAASGAKSYFTYKVTHADGTVTEDRTFYSTFRPWQAVYMVGIQ